MCRVHGRYAPSCLQEEGRIPLLQEAISEVAQILHRNIIEELFNLKAVSSAAIEKRTTQKYH